MSIALENNRIEEGGFLRRNQILGFVDSGDRPIMRENGHSDVCCSSSSSSSIGKNSDDLEQGCRDEDEEVQSKLKKTSFDSAVDALEQALPIRRGISKFYNGKSKSFASLCDAACSSIKDITKPENAHTRKRKSLLSYNLLYDKGRTSLLKTPGIGGGISKRPIPSSRSTLALAMAMSNYEGIVVENESSPERNKSPRMNPRTPSGLPLVSALHPSPWRSLSLADLQHCAVSASVVNPNLMGKRTKTDEVS